MKSIQARIVGNLRRPLPDLVGYLADKVRSCLWRLHLGRVGRGFHVCQGARLQGCASIFVGDGFYAAPMLWIEAVHTYLDYRFEPIIEIGANVTCSQFVHIAATKRVTIGDSVLIGSRVHITDHAHGTYHGDVQDSPDVPPARRRPSEGRPVVIGRNVWLGDGVVVLPGVTIGECRIVGANSVVTRALPPRVIAVGAPATPIKAYDAQSGRWLPISRTA